MVPRTSLYWVSPVFTLYISDDTLSMLRISVAGPATFPSPTRLSKKPSCLISAHGISSLLVALWTSFPDPDFVLSSSLSSSIWLALFSVCLCVFSSHTSLFSAVPFTLGSNAVSGVPLLLMWPFCFGSWMSTSIALLSFIFKSEFEDCEWSSEQDLTLSLGIAPEQTQNCRLCMQRRMSQSKKSTNVLMSWWLVGTFSARQRSRRWLITEFYGRHSTTESWEQC